MRTTVNIDGALLEAIKLRAAHEGRKLGEVINDVLREDLVRHSARTAPARHEPLITFRGNGVKPGVNLDCMSELLDIMDGVS